MWGGGAYQEAKGGAPSEQLALPAHSMQEQGEIEGTIHQVGRGEKTQSGSHAHHAWPDIGDGGHPPRPTEAPHWQTKRCGGGRRRGTGNHMSQRGRTSPVGGEGGAQ